MIVVFITVAVSWTTVSANLALFKTTCDRIASHGYPCERHTVQTADGYNLTVFRIPHSHRLGNKMDQNKSAVLLQHGLFSSSDGWVLNGPNDGLPFMLADAGHDVWIANARGTAYSQRHVYLSPWLPAFWDFSWHELGVYDIPAMLDHIIATTKQDAIHYVGHSQGTTTFIVMLSVRPEYNKKIKTSHLLAPPIFMDHMKSPPVVLVSPILEKPNIWTNLVATSKFKPNSGLIHALAPPICRKPKVHRWCTNILFLFFGGRSPYLNDTLLNSILETHPADCSTRQVLHFIQERNSKEFRNYDYGIFSNILKYGTFEPPSYQLQNVNTKIPIDFYYSDNDDWVAVEDIQHLENILGSKISLHQIMLPKFNHIDFIFSNKVKSVINDCIVDQINESENKPYHGHMCGHYRKN